MTYAKPVVTADTLTKILLYLKTAGVPVAQTMIAKGIGKSSYVTKSGLAWLCFHELITKKKDTCKFIYYYSTKQKI